MVAHLFDQHPDTLLSVGEVAPLLHRAKITIQLDVTRRPEHLPAITRIGGRVFFRIGDVQQFISDCRKPTPAPLRTRVKAELRAQ